MDTSIVTVLYGLGGAIGWGVSNFFAAKASQKTNPLATVFSSQSILFLSMAVMALMTRPVFDVSLSIFVIIALSYLFFTIGLVISYKAYAIGPISITSPIVGAFSIIVVASSVILFDEILQPNQWIGLMILFIGLFLASMEKRKTQSIKTSGISLAFIALILIGLGLSGFVYAIGEIGWFVAVLLGYFFTAFWAAIILIIKNQLKPIKVTKNVLGLVVFQLLGTISVSYGIERSLAAIIVPVSSLNPLATSVLGVLIFKEVMNKRRIFSVALIIFSLVIISLDI
jgi:drug/metabolite transporter (DMT)-like permease